MVRRSRVLLKDEAISLNSCIRYYKDIPAWLEQARSRLGAARSTAEKLTSDGLFGSNLTQPLELVRRCGFLSHGSVAPFVRASTRPPISQKRGWKCEFV